MSEDREVAKYYSDMYSEILDRSGGEYGTECSSADYKENIFSSMAAERLTEIGIIPDMDLCHFFKKTLRGGVMKVNGYAFDEARAELTLLTTIFHGNSEPENIPTGDIWGTAEQAKRFAREAISDRKFYTELEMSQTEYDMTQHIFEIRKSIRRIKIIILIFGITRVEEKEPEKLDNIHISYDVWDITRMYRVDSSGREYEPIIIDFSKFGISLPCIQTQAANNEYETYVLVFPGAVIQQIYDDYGSRLLELNVRSFLQVRGKVNKGIRNTLKTEPDRFLAYNNGISITADKVTTKLDEVRGNHAITSITGMQIVNGAQTVASIHHAAVVDKLSLDNVYLQAKITVIGGELKEELVPYISRFSNSQNKVNEADFSSNDPYHVKMQQHSKIIWCPGERSKWFYERARGQYDVEKAKVATPAQKKDFERKNPKSQRFNKTDLAKYLNSWDQMPHIVSRGAQYNFVQFMNNMKKTRNPDWLPDEKYYKELISKAILFNNIDKIAVDEGIGAYKANVVTYTMAYISYRTLGRISFDDIWTKQNITPGLDEAVHLWCTEVHDIIVRSAGDKNVTQWCKKEECWVAVRSADLNMPDILKKEMAVGGPLPTVGSKEERQHDQMSETDMENIATTMGLNPEQWLKIHGWGAQSKRLAKTQIGIALTLSSYASGGWKNVPSRKQARSAVVIIQIAKEAGILESTNGEYKED